MSAVAAACTTVMSLRGVDKHFGSTHALDHVDLDLRAGEVHCLVGENGAGKSTLLKILSGAERPDAGELEIHGQVFSRLAPRQAIELGLATIYQEPDLVGSLTVAENVFLGAERMRGPAIDRRVQRRLTSELAAALELDLDPDAIVDELSPGGRQLVQVVKALRREPQVMIMDEPTSSLGAKEKERLLALTRQLAARGIGVLYVSHFLEEVLHVGDRVTVLKDGRVVSTRGHAEVSLERLAEEMIGRSSSSFFTKEAVPLGEPVLVVERLAGAGVVEASFEVRAGEVFGLGGMVGSGRTELAELLFGARRRTAGKVFLRGREVAPRTPAQAIALGIVMLTEDRPGTGLLAKRTVFENISVARNERNGFLLGGEKRVAAAMVETLHVVTSGIREDVAALSGGNQQKVLLGRWLAVDGDVFLLDEPTKGVDIGAKQDIYELIEELARRGKAVVLISSDLAELLSLSDRIGVMRRGRVARIVEARGASEQSLAKEYVGVAAD
ncbi:MAG TPA: sugar ABC transporter ATP-binding protein [Gaiellaceae bacterium]|nr:sugar ABC transporter ATP-binding protein [Gaiellaceae bacterium]